MRILFSTTPLDGHFRPLLPLARALQARGHEVAFATEQGWHPVVEAEGFAALSAGPPHAEAWEHVRRTLRPELANSEHHLDDVFALLFAEGHGVRKVARLVEAVRQWRADAVVYESADLAAPVAAAALGITAVHHSWGALLPLEWYERAATAMSAGWRSVGLEPRPRCGAFDGLYVDLSPPSFALESPPGETVPLRPVAAEPEPPPPWVAGLEAPVVYATLGTLFNDPALLRLLADAAAPAAGSVVVTTGRDVDPADLGTVAPNVRVERFVRQAHVVPACAAVVAHGGSGSTLGTVAHGVPLVLLPMGADQFDVALRCERAGAGVVVRPEDVTVETVEAALRRVLDDPAYAQAAHALADEIAAMPSPGEVAAAVEAWVAAR